ncbi:MAG: CDP-diacylglycerol--glycerol-3-phosphate 3-phosphatidyltransferase [Gammaproteobacteria bacterium]|nr:CDP-diacylglycerol--glycerol-3-phosphate 3-phosphatidyltransferase [Gammaproteobacteria bacterium]
MNLPMLMTFLRILLIPVLVIIFYIPYAWTHIIAAIIFSLASITDWLDGYLARKLNQTSDFGAFLDPVADKLMVASALVLLVKGPHFPYIAIPAIVIISREIAISALREWMAEVGKRASVAVSYMGKIKTTTQFLAIISLLACNPFQFGPLKIVGYILLYFAALLTLWSMVMYLKAAAYQLKT